MSAPTPTYTPLPVLPAELQALVPTSDDSICAVLIKYFKFQIKIWRIRKAMIKSDGTFSDNFKAAICYIVKHCSDQT